MRASIQDFSLANPIYAGATVSFYTVSGGAKTATLATLYAATSGATTLTNPQTLDSDGKFQQAVYIADPVIATVSGLSIDDHDTGIITVYATWNGDVALEYAFDASTTMADPGTGDIRFNHATIASVTQIAISALAASSGNPDLSDFIATWDDSTNTAHMGTLMIREMGTATVAVFTVTGVTDNGTWLQVAVTHVSSAGTLSAADVVFCGFSRTGNAGTGVGDVVGPSSSVDGEMVLFDSTTGKLVKRASTTGLLKATSGVLAAAAAGTDYAPATSGSSILKGNGSGGFSNASPGTDYAPATSGSGVLKGDGSGGTSTATAGTDYAKGDTAQNWSASQRSAFITDNDLSFDLSASGNNYACTPSGSGTLTFTNIAANDGKGGYIKLVNASNYTISADANTKISAATLAAISVTGTYILAYIGDATNVYVTASPSLP